MHAADPDSLAHCVAIVAAPNAFDSEALISLGQKLKFGAVSDSSHFSGNDWHAHRLLFFLVHYGIGVEAKRKLLHKVRHAGSVNICFAPVVLFLQNGRPEEVSEHIEMGFDDVVSLPEDAHALRLRLAGQIGREQTYIETRTYLGPDRRRLEPPGHSHPDRSDGEEHARLTLLRQPEEGVQILRRQVVHKRH